MLVVFEKMLFVLWKWFSLDLYASLTRGLALL
jgi:hypothetical protein